MGIVMDPPAALKALQYWRYRGDPGIAVCLHRLVASGLCVGKEEAARSIDRPAGYIALAGRSPRPSTSSWAGRQERTWTRVEQEQTRLELAEAVLEL
eukprot:1176824-Prorocentrum_minimum.AAC.1